jgi:hypothetical protein
MSALSAAAPSYVLAKIDVPAALCPDLDARMVEVVPGAADGSALELSAGGPACLVSVHPPTSRPQFHWHLAPNIASRLPVCFVELLAHFCQLPDVAVVYKECKECDGSFNGKFDMRISITVLDKTAKGESVYNRLPDHFKTEVGKLLLEMFGPVDAYKIRRLELTIYAASTERHAGETLEWVALDWHKDGDLDLELCGPSARMCVFRCVCQWVRVRACVSETYACD